MAAPARASLRGGILAWLAASLVFCSAAAVLAWMLLLPLAAQVRFATTTGAQLRLLGLMSDPFAGAATVTGWTLRASEAPGAPLLARGGAASVSAPAWHTVLIREPGATLVVERLDLVIGEAHLAPDATDHWPLLAVLAASGLPYERGGAIGNGPRVLIKKLHLSVQTVVVRNAATGRDTAVRVDWVRDFKDLDHLRPLVTALLAATRTPAGLAHADK